MKRTYAINTLNGSHPLDASYIVNRLRDEKSLINRTKLRLLLDTNETTIVTLNDGMCLSVEHSKA